MSRRKKNRTQPAGGRSTVYLKNVASHPELVAGRDADGRADLELPLSTNKPGSAEIAAYY
jgi:hypothetical protein